MNDSILTRITTAIICGTAGVISIRNIVQNATQEERDYFDLELAELSVEERERMIAVLADAGIIGYGVDPHADDESAGDPEANKSFLGSLVNKLTGN